MRFVAHLAPCGAAHARERRRVLAEKHQRVSPAHRIAREQRDRVRGFREWVGRGRPAVARRPHEARHVGLAFGADACDRFVATHGRRHGYTAYDGGAERAATGITGPSAKLTAGSTSSAASCGTARNLEAIVVNVEASK